ncbi:hypothetical protein AUR64_15620 [Haloprofundus marisrubri]|uniref:Uncharacterized protein n=1 Tax=Haloprofundus marisrubri TaxID=1514971 RepID=A0A0W1R8B2_9EURY|nr:hypothetical protein AUR64_15620 [Haloprofundus marisrubri]
MLSTSVAGCTELVTSPDFTSGASTSADSAVLRYGPTPTDGAPFAAKVFTTAETARSEIHWDALPEPYHEYRDIDFSESFLAVYVTRYQVLPPGQFKGWCPLSKLDGDEFVFELKLETWPPVAGNRVQVQLEQWMLNGNEPPKRARVDVSLVDYRTERICTD